MNLDWDAKQARVALYLDNAIAQENNQASLYCPSRDYQHLLVYRYGQVSTKTNDLELEMNTINPRDTVQEKQRADTCIHNTHWTEVCFNILSKLYFYTNYF